MATAVSPNKFMERPKTPSRGPVPQLKLEPHYYNSQRSRPSAVTMRENYNCSPRSRNESLGTPSSSFSKANAPLRRVNSEPFIHSWDLNLTKIKKKKERDVERERSKTGKGDKYKFQLSSSSGSSGTNDHVPPMLSQKSVSENQFVSTILKNDNTGKYMKKIEESKRRLTKLNIKLSTRSINDVNIVTQEIGGKVVLISAKLDKLIDFVTSEDSTEEFISTFLLTYRYYTTPADLLNLLMKRYEVVPTNTDSKIAKKMKKALQIRVILVCKVWLETHFSDFNVDIQSTMWNWCNTILKEHSDWGKLLRLTIEKKNAERILMNLFPVIMKMATKKIKETKMEKNQALSLKGTDILDYLKDELNINDEVAIDVGSKMLNQNYLKYQKTKTLRASKSSSSSTLSPTFSKANSFLLKNIDAHSSKGILDFQALELAKQLCLIEFSLLRAIQLSEISATSFSHKTKKNELAPHVLKMIDMSNSVSYWVATEIVTTPNLKKRVAVLKHFISFADQCYNLHNYNGLFEIMGGLNNGAVRRLKETWKKLSPKDMELFVKLEAMTNSDENWKIYRNKLKQLKGCGYPSIPYLGLFLKDLTALEDVTDPTILGNGNINFKKMQNASSLFEQFQSFQELPYNFKYKSKVQCYLLNGRSVIDEKELYTKSKFIESAIKINYNLPQKGKKYTL